MRQTTLSLSGFRCGAIAIVTLALAVGSRAAQPEHLGIAALDEAGVGSVQRDAYVVSYLTASVSGVEQIGQAVTGDAIVLDNGKLGGTRQLDPMERFAAGVGGSIQLLGTAASIRGFFQSGLGVGRVRGCNSFAPETQVQVCDGETRALADLAPGDEVLTRNERTGEESYQPVIHVTSSPHAELVRLSFAPIADDGTLLTEAHTDLTTSPGHEIWNEDTGAWTEVRHLYLGATLRLAGDRRAILTGTHSTRAPPGQVFWLYDLTVAEGRSYFVSAPGAGAEGGRGLWVHNCPTGGGSGGRQSQRERVSGRNPPISPRQKLHTDDTPGKSQFNSGVDVEAVTRAAWERGKPEFDKHGKLLGKRFTFKHAVGTSPGGYTQHSVFVHWSPNHGIHGVPTTVPQR